MKFFSRLIFLLILPLLVPSFNTIRAEEAQQYIPEYSNSFSESWRWQNYPELIGRGCRCMVEDKSGTLWFGVSDGVMSFNGLEWRLHAIAEDSTAIQVVALDIGDDGSLYACTNTGISVYKSGTWEKVELDLDFGDGDSYYYNRIPIITSMDGSIWVGTKQGALRIKNGHFTLYRPDVTINIVNPQITISVAADFDVYSIDEAENGELWFGLRDGRIYRCQVKYQGKTTFPMWIRVDTDKSYTPVKYPLIKVDEQGDVYVASTQYGSGINIYNGIKWTHEVLNEKFLFSEFYTDIIKLHSGNVCLAGLGRIFIRQNDEWVMYESPTYPFSSNRLLLYESSDQSLWIIGLRNEVWKIDLSISKWATLQELNFQTEDQDGNYWFISFDRKIVRHTPATDKWIQYDQTSGVLDAPVVLFTTKSGKIWIAGSHQLIAATAFFDGNSWIKKLHPILGFNIDRRATFEADDASLWFGSGSDIDLERGHKGGFVRYLNVDYEHPEKIIYEYYHPDENFGLNSVYGIGQTRDGLIWVGQLGLYNYNRITRQWHKVTGIQGLENSFTDCIDTTPSGDLWIGTRTNGLFWRNSDTGEWYNFTTKDGLSSNTIVDVFAESNNSIWVSTERDISHYDGKTWMASLFAGYFKNYRDGISIRRTRDGSFWVNQNPPMWYQEELHEMLLSKNLNSQFKTVKYLADNIAPETMITFFQERVEPPGNVILSWTGNDPWKSTSTENIQYSYRIDDDPWSPFAYETTEIFLSVEHGMHTFEVRARDMDFNVDESPASIVFRVMPPIWLRLWFLLLIFSFFAIVTYFIIFLYHRNNIIREISETKVRLFANISHELRTPLVLISEPLSRVLDSPLLDPQLVRPLNVVNRNAQRLLRLVNQVLDFRKMEAGQLKFEPNKGDIVDFLREEVFAFEEAAESKEILLKYETQIDALITWFDFDKIEKIIFNILSNAVKYTPVKGSITVAVSVEGTHKSHTIQIKKHKLVKYDRRLKIEINDSGIGIEKRNLKKIFSRFYQVEDEKKTVVGGTGIGLAVAREMVNIHHGSIDVESKIGEGTTFRIKIPLLDEHALDGVVCREVVDRTHYGIFNYPGREMPAEKPSRGDKPGVKDGSKVLVVEDNPDLREYIKEELEKNYVVFLANDGLQGFELAARENPDIIISDVMMPQMDGIEFCTKIKTDERTSHIAVILLTARASQEHRIEGLETGADDYLTKPFVFDELRLRINNIIESRRKFSEQFGKFLKIEPSQVNITSADQKLIERAIEVIESNISDPEFGVEKFSHLIGISRVGLYNKLKGLTGHSVQEFIFIVKLKRAAQLLAESGMSVTQVCYEVGFKDPSHFTKLFKKQFGVTPRAYKVKHVKPATNNTEF